MPDAIVCHRAGGRLRIRIADRRGDAAYFDRVGRALGEAEWVTEVRANPGTATILVLHDGGPPPLDEFAAVRGLFRLLEGGEAPRMHVRRVLAVVGEDFARLTGQSWVLADALFVTFATLAVIEALRGNLTVPATTLAWYALNALSMPDAQG